MYQKPNKTKWIKVGIIGVGMVGEPVMRWFVEHKGYKRGRDLFCYDADPKKSYDDDVNRADVIFVAVPTPPNPDGSCNTSIVRSAVSTIRDGKIVIIKSTVEPGTVEELQRAHPRKRFIFNPEFLTESQAWLDYLKPDRQIVGHTARSYRDAKEILTLLPQAYFERPWSSDYSKKDITASEAELAKYASNIFGYIKVIYGNILADVCHAMSVNFKNKKIPARIDYQNVREVISADPRIGPAWLNVEHGDYCGAGGFCFPKDMNAFIKFGDNLITRLSSRKRQTDIGLVRSLSKGLDVLKSIAAYNQALLAWQGLTVEDVSKHNREIILHKRKPIRRT